MAIINKKHPEILDSASGKNECYVSLHEDRLYFTNTAAKLFKLVPGRFLQFVNDGAHWSFFQNDDPDGFTIQADSKQNSNAVMVCNRALIKMIMRSTRMGSGARLFLAYSNAKVQSCDVIEIRTDKTYEQLGKF